MSEVFYQKAIDNGHSMTLVKYSDMVFCDHCGRRSIADKRLDCNSRADFQPCGPVWEFGTKSDFLASLDTVEEYSVEDDETIAIPAETFEFIRNEFVPILFKDGLRIQAPIMIGSYNGYLYLEFELSPSLSITFSIWSRDKAGWSFDQNRYTEKGKSWLEGIDIVHKVFSVCI